MSTTMDVVMEKYVHFILVILVLIPKPTKVFLQVLLHKLTTASVILILNILGDN